MKNKLFIGVVTLGVFFLVATGCQKVPQVQLDQAKAAIESAKTVEADRYLPTEFIALQDAYNAAVNSIEATKSKSFLKRNYKEAAEQLATVKSNLDALVANTATKKEEVKKEAQTLVNEVTSLIAEGKELFKKAPKGKEGKAALDKINQDFIILDNTLNAALTNISGGNFIGAKDSLNAAKIKATSIKEELQAAIDKTKRR